MKRSREDAMVDNPCTKTLRCVDFFSGIGGNHYAMLYAAAAVGKLAQMCVSLKFAAVEVNDRAVAVYKHNFPTAKVHQKKVEDVPVEFFRDAFVADVWLLSPPCQPFTRLGEQRDMFDSRCTGFARVMQLIDSLPSESLPQLIFVENVKNFEVSMARNKFIRLLRGRGYEWEREYLINPTVVFGGWPNSRCRYYFLAIRRRTTIAPRAAPSSGAAAMQGNAAEENCVIPFQNRELGDSPWSRLPSASLCVADFLSASVGNELLVPRVMFDKMQHVMDCVTPTSTRCCCFTKGYGHKAEGSGSVLLLHDEQGSARFFSGDEIARFLGLPVGGGSPAFREVMKKFLPPAEDVPIVFSFPQPTTLRQQWMLLGNSVNVLAVAAVLFEGLKELLAVS